MKSSRQQRKRRPCIEAMERRELLAGDLRIVELNFNPHEAMVEFGERDAESDDFEFVEVMNVGDAPLNVRGYEISDGITFIFDQQFLNPNERIVVTKDLRDFRSRFGQQARVALGNDGDGGKEGEYKGSLNNGGEVLELRDPSGAIIQQFAYFDAGEWPSRADGLGSSLEVIDPLGDYSDPKNWRPSSEYGGSPGVAGSGFVGDVVINELLTHTDLPQIDAIELFNRTDQAIDMSNWYLSDSAENLRRFKIDGADSTIPPNDYRVYDENRLGFSFRGQESDNAFLIEATADGRLIRFVDAVSYGATENGVSLGRWNNGEGELFPMDDLSFEDHNTGPLFDVVVISEVNYHPRTIDGVPLSANDLEFVEIYNRDDTSIDLSLWRLTTAVEIEIPEGTVLRGNSSLLALSFDPLENPQKTRTLLDAYQIDDDVQLFGPYRDPVNDPHPDLLDDDGETLILERPEDIFQCPAPDRDECLGYVLVDRVIYRDVAPWPTDADGQGRSLTRALDRLDYGDFPTSWQAAMPTPGRIEDRLPGDVDGDGDVNASDIDHLCANLGTQEPQFDLNEDRVVNQNDLDFLIHDILQTTVGDTNLDGRFDSSDLVAIFRAGEFEDGLSRNSGWATGDWNCDREFDSGDLVTAFAAGGYTAQAALVNPAGVLGVERTELNRARSFTSADETKSVEVSASEARMARRLPVNDMRLEVTSLVRAMDPPKPLHAGELDEALLRLLR